MQHEKVRLDDGKREYRNTCPCIEPKENNDIKLMITSYVNFDLRQQRFRRF